MGAEGSPANPFTVTVQLCCAPTPGAEAHSTTRPTRPVSTRHAGDTKAYPGMVYLHAMGTGEARHRHNREEIRTNMESEHALSGGM